MSVLVMLNLLLQVGLTVVLFLRFRATRNGGYLLLAVPLVLWSFVVSPVHWLIDDQLDRHTAGEAMIWPLSLLSGMTVGRMAALMLYSTSTLRIGLLLLGFIWIGRGGSREPTVVPTDQEISVPGAPTAT